MVWLKNNINFKIISSILFIVLMILIFFINSWLVSNLRESVTRTAVGYQSFIQTTLETELENIYQDSNENNSDSSIELFRKMLKHNDLPIIIKDIKSGIAHAYGEEFENKEKAYIDNSMIEMEQIFEPLPIQVSKDGKMLFDQMLYYGDSRMIEIIKLTPLIQVSVVLFLIIFGFIYYSTSKRNFQNAIYVGVFKETAHQLGTPISSLLGWSENIKDKGFDPDILEYIDQDISKLKEISERFSKIGSRMKLSKINFSNLLNEIVSYSNKRVPKTKEIAIKSSHDSNIEIEGDKILLSWAFENLIKNSIEAIDSNTGSIEINVNKEDLKTIIDLSDTGKGIQRIHWKRIFKPGYSTKSRGWGVGLSLTKRIIEQIHSGKIYVLSSSREKTVIRIIL